MLIRVPERTYPTRDITCPAGADTTCPAGTVTIEKFTIAGKLVFSIDFVINHKREIKWEACLSLQAFENLTHEITPVFIRFAARTTKAWGGERIRVSYHAGDDSCL